MKKVKNPLSRKSVAVKIQIATQIVTMMTGNATYPTPNPTLLVIAAAIAALALAYEDALDGGKAKKALVRQLTKELNVLFVQLAAYVQNVSDGDEQKILSSGFEVVKPKEPVGKLPAPQNLHASPSGTPQQVDMDWEKVKKASSYEVYQSKDAATWEFVASCTKSKYSATGLTSGLKMWFQVIAINTDGKGDPSDPANSMVP